MSRLSRTLAVSLVLGLASPLIQAGGSQAVVPKEWLNKWRNSPFDLNNNQVDDVLEALPPSQQVELFIDLTGCFGAADRTRLAVFGTIDFESRYFPMIHMNGVLVSSLVQLAKDPIVAFVEEDSFMYHTLSISNPSIQVKASSDYPPPPLPAPPITVHEKFPGIRGNTSMVLIDSGIDNQGANPDPKHEALPRFDGGLNCTRLSIFALGCTQNVDPDDTTGTGTHAAAIAVGQGEGGANPPHEGIAPEEGLYDVRIPPDPTIPFPRFGFRKSLLTVALDTIAAKMDAPFAPWTPKIIVIPWATCRAGDDLDGISNAINTMTNMKNVLVVTSMGNCSTCLGVAFSACASCPCSVLTSPAAAQTALTVGASSNAGPLPTDPRTVTRTDDSLTGDNLIDPRPLPTKPDLVAPGVDISSADFTTTNGYVAKSGSSLAAAHVAGCAALALQASAWGMGPLDLKKTLVDTAEDKGSPGWDTGWGAGALNCFAAVDRVNSGVCSDLHFDGVCGGFGEFPCFDHPAIHTKDWLVEGVENTIYVDIRNDGPGFTDPYDVRVSADCFSNGQNGYDVCTIHMPVLAPGTAAQGSCNWTPPKSGGAPGILHAALFGEVIYDRQCVPGGYKKIRHNEEIQMSFSPAVVAMSVENQTYQTLTMELQGTFDCGGGSPCTGWTFSPSSNFFPLTTDDCSPTVMLQMTPGAGAVRDAMVHVSVIGHEAGGGTQDLGGVTMRARLACPTSNLRFSNKTLFTWSAPTGSSACPSSLFDVARGSLPIPKFNSDTLRGDFSSATCLQSDIFGAQFTDSTPLSPGSGFYYLTRAGGPVPGSWDVHDAKQKGLADDTLKTCP